MMTCDARIATDWAIHCFGLKQFQYVKASGTIHRSCFAGVLDKDCGINREKLYPVTDP